MIRGWILAAAITAGALGDTPDPEGGFSDAGELLGALETADEDVRTFSASIMWLRHFELADDDHTRYGRVAYADNNPGDSERIRTFAIAFDTLIVDNTRRPIDERWLFDGRWLIEKNVEQKQFIKREMAPPGRTVDLLRIGEGPLPIPIGQKREEILARYDADLRPSAEEAGEGEFLEAASGTVQLLLTPRSERKQIEEFREVRVWYDRDSLHPVMARAINRAGDSSLVRLINAKVNDPGFDLALIGVETPDESEGWTVQIIEGRFVDDGARAEGDQ